ncbi:MAG TPA: ABC transporter permease [Thermoanaerobaculia bacterium]|nr:ABC transporter permease [Thermoanaerobaculia bacterium]
MKRLASAIIAVVCALPFALVIMLSLAHGWRFPAILPHPFTAELWRSIVTGRVDLGAVFARSAALSATVALLSTAASFITAKFIAYHRRRPLLLTLAYAPYVMSPVILGVCILYLYIRAGIDGTFAGVVLAQTIFAFSFGIVFFTAFWNREKLELEQLVYTMGGTTRQLYSRVLLPLSRDALILCFFQTFLISWFQYGITLLIGEGKVQTLPLKVFDYIGEANPGYAALSSCLLVIPPVVMLWINKRLLPRIL